MISWGCKRRFSETYLAMEEVFAKPSTLSTDPAVIAVIYALIWVIVPQLAHSTVIPRSSLATLHTELPSALGAAT
jgi:hypothetical protein